MHASSERLFIHGSAPFQNLLDMATTSIIFGSSFDDDQGYQQICLNINQIKIAMELGRTVVLCNLDKLYESLYDALNQVASTSNFCRLLSPWQVIVKVTEPKAFECPRQKQDMVGNLNNRGKTTGVDAS